MRLKNIVIIALLLFIFAPTLFFQIVDWGTDQVKTNLPQNADTKISKVIYFPSERYPETAKHIKEAVAVGESQICTIDRDGANQNRSQSLKGVPTKKGYDRDEWPMAMCAEGGKGAHVKHVKSSDNRGAGAWLSNQMEKFADGTKVKIVVK